MKRRHFLAALSASPLLAQTPAPKPEPELDWIDAKKLTVEGLGFKDVKAPYDRFPSRAEGIVPAPVWNLSRDAAGAAIRFVTSATEIRAKWSVTNKNLAGNNITAIASSGLDLYAKNDAGKFRWLGNGKPTKQDNEDTLVTGLNGASREFILYLPLRNPISTLQLGVPKGVAITPGPARTNKPIVFYGTSITHGIGASRAGMTHVAMLGRTFNREVFNLGFSGNGRMEPEVIQFVAELDPAVFVLDCLPNMGAALVKERTVPGVKQLRKTHPETPILLVEDRVYANSAFLKNRLAGHEANHAALRESYAILQAEKVPNVFYLKGDDLIGDDGEGTVDGSHPTDLGFMRQAAEFEKALRPILK